MYSCLELTHNISQLYYTRACHRTDVQLLKHWMLGRALTSYPRDNVGKLSIIQTFLILYKCTV